MGKNDDVPCNLCGEECGSVVQHSGSVLCMIPLEILSWEN